MPHTKSAEKRARQGLRRKQHNRAERSALHTVVKKARAAAESQPKAPETAKLISAAFSALDRAGRKGLIKKNEADRRKARICLARDKAAKKA